jgi:hypothetical protein
VHLDQVSGQPTHEREAEGGERERESEVEEREGKTSPHMFFWRLLQRFRSGNLQQMQTIKEREGKNWKSRDQTKVWAAS